MSKLLLIFLVFWPIMAGVLYFFLPFHRRFSKLFVLEIFVILESLLAFLALKYCQGVSCTLFYLTGNLSIGFKLDGLGMVFIGLIAVLWPFATLYSFEYMEHESHERVFFLFYTISYGVTMGIALAADVITMYCFYEMLTLVTVPLVMHTLTRDAVLASRTYLYYSLGGAAFAFIGVVFIVVFGYSPAFTPGGVLNLEKLGSKTHWIQIIYVLSFCGFSVKAAMFPFSGWLPKAGVAPTPVTALLHAVAVVKAGAFTIMRITYYSFGISVLSGTLAQKLILALTVFTIVYGCSRALKETHFKRRLAWSTVSNLSYILFGVALMTPLGLTGALNHMVVHAVMKICSFFCAGAVICKTGREYVYELDGLGRKMPKVFIIYTISGLALMGVPGLCGFISKWNLVQAAIDQGSFLAAAGVVALLISALLTAIYMLSISVRAFFPGKDFSYAGIRGCEDPGIRMLFPLCLFAAAMFVMGLHSEPLVAWLRTVAMAAA